MRKHTVFLAVIALVVSTVGPRMGQSQSPKTLAELLATAPSTIGAAPTKFETPFFVAEVKPIDGRECSVLLVTNGMAYSIYGERDAGWCNNLPVLHSLVWGRVRHSGVASFLRQSNTADVVSDYIDLVYIPGQKPKTRPYMIAGSQAIGADWGQ